MSAPPVAPPDPAALYADDVPWTRRVAWPQLLTLSAITLAVLGPLGVVLLLAA